MFTKHMSGALRIFGGTVTVLADETSQILDARGLSALSVLTDADATATVSRVDEESADEDSEDDAGNYTVAPATLTTIPVDWPFYRVTAADGNVRVALA